MILLCPFFSPPWIDLADFTQHHIPGLKRVSFYNQPKRCIMFSGCLGANLSNLAMATLQLPCWKLAKIMWASAKKKSLNGSIVHSLTETNSKPPLKINGWKMTFPFWDPAYFQAKHTVTFQTFITNQKNSSWTCHRNISHIYTIKYVIGISTYKLKHR